MSILKPVRKRTKSFLVALALIVGQAMGVGPAFGLTLGAETNFSYQHVDTFSSGSLSGYTQVSDYPGVWSVDSAAQTLTATGGKQSKLIANDFIAQDTAIEVQASKAVDGGVVARFQDNYNYYLLAIRDGSWYPANVEIYKRTQGTYQSLGTAPVSWSAGTQASIKFVVYGTTLEAYFNGQKVLSVEDASITAPGSVGLRQCKVVGADDTVVYDQLMFTDLSAVISPDYSIEVLRPLIDDGIRDFNQGQTIPVKFRLTGADGTSITDAVPVISVRKLESETPDSVTLPTELIMPESAARYDSEDNQYIYNLSTDLMAKGKWIVIIRADDQEFSDTVINLL